MHRYERFRLAWDCSEASGRDQREHFPIRLTVPLDIPAVFRSLRLVPLRRPPQKAEQGVDGNRPSTFQFPVDAPQPGGAITSTFGKKNTMKPNWEDNPYGPLGSAMKSTFGRCALVAVTCCIGFGCGSMLAGGPGGSFLGSVIGFPLVICASIMCSQGIWVWPLVVLMTGLFMKLELPMWTLLLPFAVSVWLSYEVTQHINADPMTEISSSVRT